MGLYGVLIISLHLAIVIVQRLSLRWRVKHMMFIKHVLIICIERLVIIGIIAAKGRETFGITGN